MKKILIILFFSIFLIKCTESYKEYKGIIVNKITYPRPLIEIIYKDSISKEYNIKRVYINDSDFLSINIGDTIK